MIDTKEIKSQKERWQEQTQMLEQYLLQQQEELNKEQQKVHEIQQMQLEQQQLQQQQIEKLKQELNQRQTKENLSLWQLPRDEALIKHQKLILFQQEFFNIFEIDGVHQATYIFSHIISNCEKVYIEYLGSVISINEASQYLDRIKEFINIVSTNAGGETPDGTPKIIAEVRVKHSFGNVVHRTLFFRYTRSNQNEAHETTPTTELTVLEISGFTNFDLAETSSFIEGVKLSEEVRLMDTPITGYDGDSIQCLSGVMIGNNTEVVITSFNKKLEGLERNIAEKNERRSGCIAAAAHRDILRALNDGELSSQSLSDDSLKHLDDLQSLEYYMNGVIANTCDGRQP